MKRRLLQHGLSYTPEYRAWQCARLRCIEPTNQAYPAYGGRGITMCASWLNDPTAFLADMGPKPSPAHELDREDNDKGYQPGNCRWVLRKVNGRNRRSNRWVEAFGERRTLAEWCERCGISPGTAAARLSIGWTAEEALSIPTRLKMANGAGVAALQEKRATREATRKMPPGVKRHKRRFVARICVDGERREIGSYTTPDEAHQAYLNEKALVRALLEAA